MLLIYIQDYINLDIYTNYVHNTVILYDIIIINDSMFICKNKLINDKYLIS